MLKVHNSKLKSVLFFIISVTKSYMYVPYIIVFQRKDNELFKKEIEKKNLTFGILAYFPVLVSRIVAMSIMSISYTTKERVSIQII
jgi:hypothetical protein